MSQSTQVDVSRLERKIDNLRAETDQLNALMRDSRAAIETANKNILILSQKFDEMVNEQRRQAALQQAMTELVRVRQELEQNFGNHKIVRETMLGVLQATDLALVKKSTISRVSEELMLSTPDYWLAPCLIAVAAWIGNDRDLAERAIAEAVKRDEEQTAITMALICRRNNKVDLCYEWLARYFEHQSAANISEGSFAYIDAYANGVFGPDKKHMCDDYMARWMNEIRGNSSTLEASQEKIWNAYCGRFNQNIARIYPDLSETAVEYERISDYVGRILAVDPIAENLTGINNAYVDHNKLKADIDSRLMSIIAKHSEKEEPLRKEEEYLQAVKYFEGDTAAAKQSMLKLEQDRKQSRMNLIEQMSNVILTDKEVSPSQRKTALSFLSGHIRNGFNSYITEKKAAFPNHITLSLDGWNGVTVDGNNAVELSRNYENAMLQNRMAEIEAAKKDKEKVFFISAIVAAVLGAISLFAMPPAGIALLALAGFLFYKSVKTKKATIEKIALIDQTYAARIMNGKAKLGNAAEQWRAAQTVVYYFENNPVREIIA